MTGNSDQSGPARDALYDSMAIRLVSAGVTMPAAEFVSAVREAAGFRASPRQITAALEGLHDSGQTISVESVAELVKAARGERSQRQRRHAPDWQALGMAMTLQGMDGSPEGQRHFISIARQVAGPRASDSLLLRTGLVLASEDITLDPNTVGLIAKRLAKSSADLNEEQLADHILREYRSLNRTRTPRQRRQSSVPSRRRWYAPMEPMNKPGKRRWKPGGRRRKTIQFPDPPPEDH